MPRSIFSHGANVLFPHRWVLTSWRFFLEEKYQAQKCRVRMKYELESIVDFARVPICESHNM